MNSYDEMAKWEEVERLLEKHMKKYEAAFTALSEESFAEDWNSPEDAIYDEMGEK